MAASWSTRGFYTLSRTGATYLSAGWGLTAVDPMGAVLWSRTIVGLNAPAMTTTAIGNDGTVFIAFQPYGSPVLEIRALDPVTGTDLWSMSIPGGNNPYLNNPVIGGGGSLLVSDGDTLWAVR